MGHGLWLLWRETQGCLKTLQQKCSVVFGNENRKKACPRWPALREGENNSVDSSSYCVGVGSIRKRGPSLKHMGFCCWCHRPSGLATGDILSANVCTHIATLILQLLFMESYTLCDFYSVQLYIVYRHMEYTFGTSCWILNGIVKKSQEINVCVYFAVNLRHYCY